MYSVRHRFGHTVHNALARRGNPLAVSSVHTESPARDPDLNLNLNSHRRVVFPWRRNDTPMLTTDEVLAKKSYLKRVLYLARSQVAHEIIRHYLSNPTMETMSSEVGIK